MVIDELVTVGIVNTTPKYVIWKGKNHIITKIGLHHNYRSGQVLYHIFSVLTNTIFMKLEFNTENLSWRLLEISDGI